MAHDRLCRVAIASLRDRHPAMLLHLHVLLPPFMSSIFSLQGVGLANTSVLADKMQAVLELKQQRVMLF